MERGQRLKGLMQRIEGTDVGHQRQNKAVAYLLFPTTLQSCGQWNLSFRRGTTRSLIVPNTACSNRLYSPIFTKYFQLQGCLLFPNHQIQGLDPCLGYSVQLPESCVYMSCFHLSHSSVHSQASNICSMVRTMCYALDMYASSSTFDGFPTLAFS